MFYILDVQNNRLRENGFPSKEEALRVAETLIKKDHSLILRVLSPVAELVCKTSVDVQTLRG